MTVVFYDPATGRILQVTSAAERDIVADGRPYVEVDGAAFDSDTTHHIVDGKMVPIGDAA